MRPPKRRRASSANVDNRQSFLTMTACPSARTLVGPAARPVPRSRARDAAGAGFSAGRGAAGGTCAGRCWTQGATASRCSARPARGRNSRSRTGLAALEALVAAGVPAGRIVVSVGALAIPDVVRLADARDRGEGGRGVADAAAGLSRGDHRGRDVPLLRRGDRAAGPSRTCGSISIISLGSAACRSRRRWCAGSTSGIRGSLPG